MIKPLNKRVLVEPLDLPTKSTIVLPDNADPNPGPRTFKVLAIGDKVKDININDTIIAAGFSGVKLSNGCRIMNWPEDVLAIVDGKEV